MAHKRHDKTIPSALLDATERVWASTRPSDITMRLIAREAGVSLGLAYNYVSSKEELFGAALERMAERLAASARRGRGGRDVLESLWESMEANSAFQRLMAWLVLEGYNLSEIMTRHPVIADLASYSSLSGTRDPALAGGVTAFLGISLQTFEVLVNRAMGRSDHDPGLRDAVAVMYDDWWRAHG